MKERNQVILLIGLIVLLIAINYPFLDKQVGRLLDDSQYSQVARVIDGDTIVIENNTHVRLLGINTPEKKEFYYQEAKEFLENLVLNKTIRLEKAGDNKDKYGRLLRYIFLGNENVNIKIVEMGFANYYFYSGKDKYSNDLEKAWETCMNNNKNLCEASIDICAKCVNVKLDYIINTCTFLCDINGWQIKGEGREKFIFNGTLSPNEKEKFELDLTNSSRSLFLRDGKGMLVEWKN